jgi:mono/diheme cytochrome c family protein
MAVATTTAPPPDTQGQLDPVQQYARQRAVLRGYVLLAVVFLLGMLVFWGIFAQVPVEYEDDAEHFKYGSIGSDVDAGLPYWIWWVLPDLFARHLPEPDRYLALPEAERTPRAAYSQFGFVYEDGRPLPIGFTQRRVLMNRVGLNCAVCHVATVRVTPGMDPERIYGRVPAYTSPAKERAVVLGMPAVTTDLGAYLRFLHACAADPDFTAENVLAAIDRRHRLGPIDRALYKAAVPEVQKTLREQAADFAFLRTSPPSGPGRVDTFNPYKTHVFKFPPDGSVGTADFPSIWNQRPREGMRLHWDGNNTSVFERNISASLGAGATPVSLDVPRMLRVAYWLGAPDPKHDLTAEEIRTARADPRPRPGELPIPQYPFAIDHALAARGGAVYAGHCASCHHWQGEYIGEVVPVEKVGTDPERLNSFTHELAANQNTLGAGTWWRFRHFRKTTGYVNMPLDGLWARAPYLHNGSVATLAELLEAPGKGRRRPEARYRGDDEYDPRRVGFRSDRDRSADGRKLFPFDHAARGNSDAGHLYGTALDPDEKTALIEYLKTL